MSNKPDKNEKDNNVISLFSKKKELSNKFNAAAKDYFKENTTIKEGQHYVPPPPPTKEGSDNGTLPDDSTLNQEYRRKQDEAKKKRESNNRDVARLYNLHKGPSSYKDKR